MVENLVLKLADVRIHEFAETFADSHVAGRPGLRECEAFLQKGIDSARFLTFADTVFRDADARGILPYDHELTDAMEKLRISWLAPCQAAEAWIDALGARGDIPANASQFRDVCSEMRDRDERSHWRSIAEAARSRSTAEEPW